VVPEEYMETPSVSHIPFPISSSSDCSLVSIKMSYAAGHWWLMPIIIPTEETEVRIMFQSQTLSNSSRDTTKKTYHKKGPQKMNSAENQEFYTIFLWDLETLL
jgi:hypothetical protein